MKPEDIASAKELLVEAQNNLVLLQNNDEHMPARKALQLSVVIRESILNSQELKTLCDNDTTFAQSRKNLLDDIHIYQIKLINEIVHGKEERSMDMCHVIDFDRAKTDMVEMIENELSKHLFDELESPKLFEGISECEKHLATISRVSENCRNGKFIALILGEFQSGKSTTIDALCDGRHISAIGDGIATSAVLVSVSYGEKDTLKIYWRDKNQLLMIFERIKQILPEFEWNSFDLDKTDDRSNLMYEISQVRQNSDKSLKADDIKFLMICDLILAYYGTDTLQTKIDSLHSVSNVSKITRFPEDGEKKWMKDGVKGLTIDDAIFIFIDSVSCTTPSQTLKELNCTVIDSPGLFNSAYDTMVTESAMVAAHAIVYILPYEKAISKEVCESLYTIRDKYPDVHKKLFVVNNVSPLKSNAFIDFNRQFIKNTFGPDKEIFPYDAKMSYLCQLRQRYDKGMATKDDFAHLMHAVIKTAIGKSKELKFHTFDEAWQYHINVYKMTYGMNETSSMADCLYDAGFFSMIAALKSFIVSNEAYAVILSNALIPMLNELFAISRELEKRYVEKYTTSHDEMVSLWQKRIDNAQQFQKYVSETVKNELFGNCDGISLFEKITKDEYDKIFSPSFYTQMARAIAATLYDNKSTILASQTGKALLGDIEVSYFPPRIKFKDEGNFKVVFGNLITPLITKQLTDLIASEMKFTLGMIDSGQDGIVNDKFSPVADKIKLLLSQKWDSLFKDDDVVKMNDYITVPRNLKSCAVEKTADIPDTGVTSSLGVGGILLGGVVAQVTAIVTGVAAMIAGYIGAILCDPTGASQLVTLALCVLLGLGGLFVTAIAPDKIRDTFIDFLSMKVEPMIMEKASDRFQELVSDQMRSIFERYANGRVVDLQKMRNERDIALTPNPNVEEECFRAVEHIEKIGNQISVYDKYEEVYIRQ